MPKATRRNPHSPILDAALCYAARGWQVFPARFVGNEKKSYKSAKHSNGRAWGKTTDASEVRRDFKRWPQAGIGIATGADSKFFVVEIDTIEGHGVDGAASLRALEAEHSALPDTLMAESPTGSVHRYFKHPGAQIKIAKPTLAPGIDVKGDGGMVIAPPSLRPGKGTYRWLNANIIADAPDWLLARVTAEGAAPTPNEKLEADIEQVVEALALIPNDDDVDRDAWIRVGMATFAATKGGGFDAFDAWSRRYKGYDADNTAKAWKGFAKSPPKRIGAGTLFHLAKQAWPGWEDDPHAETTIKQFAAVVWDKKQPSHVRPHPAEAKPKAKSEQELLTHMNAEYCVIQDGGKTRVLRFDLNEQLKDGYVVHRRLVPTYFAFGDFHNFHKNKKVWVDDKPVPLGHWWTGHPQRRSYKGLTFRPDLQDEVVDGRLNLWRGWGVTPIEGDCSLMRRHIREVLASGNDDADAYIMNWLAWAVQHPAEQAEVALVLKGGRGTGKGTLGNAMMHIFGQHAVHVSSVRHLIHHHNVHLRDACFLFADEAYWPGDKSGEGQLKRLITEPTLAIEPKFVDVITVRNMLHVLMASNEDWVFPAGEDERRYAAFQISEHKRQDEAWFKPLYEQLKTGGYAAMLYDLLRRDLKDWHPRKIPMTEALREQQIRSLRPLDAWVLEFLEVGVLPAGEGADRPSRAVSRAEPDFDQRNPRNGLFDLARERHPQLRHVDDQVLANHLKQWGCTPWRNNTKRGWEFPPLAQCRAAWERRYPGWQWRHPDVTEWQEEDINGLVIGQ